MERPTKLQWQRGLLEGSKFNKIHKIVVMSRKANGTANTQKKTYCHFS